VPLRGAFMSFSVFMGGGHPHLPAQFPPFRVFHTPLPHTPNTATPTAQRPTPPGGEIEVFYLFVIGAGVDPEGLGFVGAFEAALFVEGDGLCVGDEDALVEVLVFG